MRVLLWLAVAVAATSTKTKSHRMNALFNDKVNSNEDKRMTIVIQLKQNKTQIRNSQETYKLKKAKQLTERNAQTEIYK